MASMPASVQPLALIIMLKSLGGVPVQSSITCDEVQSETIVVEAKLQPLPQTPLVLVVEVPPVLPVPPTLLAPPVPVQGHACLHTMGTGTQLSPHVAS